MHKIHDKEFTLDDFSCEHLWHVDQSIEDYVTEHMDKNESCWAVQNPKHVLNIIIGTLNFYRETYLKSKRKKDWWQLIQLLPSSYNQKRTIMLNYEVLHNMYFSRKNHKLDEWREFCKWIESLPYSEIITTRVRTEDDVYKDLIAGKISVNEARKEMGLEPIDTMEVFAKDFCIRYDISEEKFNEVIDKINSIPI